MAIRVAGRGAHVNCRYPSASIALQVERSVSMVRTAESNARDNHESNSNAVHPMTRSKLSGTRIGLPLINQVQRCTNHQSNAQCALRNLRGADKQQKRFHRPFPRGIADALTRSAIGNACTVARTVRAISAVSVSGSRSIALPCLPVGVATRQLSFSSSVNSPLQLQSPPTWARILVCAGRLRRLAEGGTAKPTKVARGFNHCSSPNLTLL